MAWQKGILFLVAYWELTNVISFEEQVLNLEYKYIGVMSTEKMEGIG